MLFECSSVSMAMICLSCPSSRPSYSSLSVADQPHSISCSFGGGGGAIRSELVGWAPQWAWPGIDRKTEREGKKEKERRIERAWQRSSTVGWSDSWLTVKAAASLRPSLAGLALLCFCSLYVFELIDYIRTDKQEDLPDWKTDRTGGFRLYLSRCCTLS